MIWGAAAAAAAPGEPSTAFKAGLALAQEGRQAFGKIGRARTLAKQLGFELEPILRLEGFLFATGKLRRWKIVKGGLITHHFGLLGGDIACRKNDGESRNREEGNGAEQMFHAQWLFIRT